MLWAFLKHGPYDKTDDWSHPYSRQQAGAPAGDRQANKYWPPVGRVANAFGDRNLICACPPLDSWKDAAE